MVEIPQYSEADTRAKLIDPVIHKRGWTEDLIRREETAGSIEIIGNKARRRSRGKVDYVLRVKVNPNTHPVAVALIEAKKNTLLPGHGLDQAKGYAKCKRLNVPFVFSSNGYQFVMFDRRTGLTSKARLIDEFPTPAELRSGYEEHIGFNLESPVAKPLLICYTGGEGTRRYYQDAAIRAVLDKIAQSELNKQTKRALLPLATGSGKTFIAVHLLKRIADAGKLKRALFVCDRDELRSQALGALQNVFGADAAEVFRKPDGTNNAKNARIHVATYQTLGIDTEEGDANFLTTYYPEKYFTHIVIDECHRSAWGKWSQVLTRNSQAVHIGLTATPRRIECKEKTKEAELDAEITANNIDYFGEPVYEYDLAQATEDGYLAACEIQKGRVNLDDTGITKEQIIALNPIDAITGQQVLNEFMGILDGPGSEAERLAIFFRNLAQFCQQHKEVIKLYVSVFDVQGSRISKFRDRNKVREKLNSSVANLIKEGIDKGLFRAVDPEITSKAINSTTETIIFDIAESTEQPRVVERFKKVEQLFLEGLLKPE